LPHKPVQIFPLFIIRLDTCQSKYLIRHFRLLKRLCAVFWADFAIPHRLLLSDADVAGDDISNEQPTANNYLPMRPMSCSHEIRKTVGFGLESFLCGEFAGSHAHVLQMPDLVTLGQSSVMHSSRIPEHKVTRVHVNLEHFTASIFKPLDVLLAEEEQVHVLDLRRRSILVVSRLALVSEELIEELRRTPHEHETTVVRTVGGKVQQALDGLHTLNRS
jgi:hypothetical protein